MRQNKTMKNLLEGLTSFLMQPCKNKNNLPIPTLEDYIFYYSLVGILFTIAYLINWVLK